MLNLFQHQSTNPHEQCGDRIGKVARRQARQSQTGAVGISGALLALGYSFSQRG
jgi:hypothetical protein